MITFQDRRSAIVFLGTLGLLFDHIPLEAQPLCINVGGCVGLVYFALDLPAAVTMLCVR